MIDSPIGHKDAACANVDPELFFPIGNTGPALEQIAEAKRVCNGCQIRQMCLDWAVPRCEIEGVWGGLSDDERRAVRLQRSRAAQAA